MNFSPDTIVGAFKLTGTPYDPDDSISATPVLEGMGFRWAITHISYSRHLDAPCVSVHIMEYDPIAGFIIRPLLTKSVF